MDPLIQMDPPELFSVSSFLSGRDLRPEAFRDQGFQTPPNIWGILGCLGEAT